MLNHVQRNGFHARQCGGVLDDRLQYRVNVGRLLVDEPEDARHRGFPRLRLACGVDGSLSPIEELVDAPLDAFAGHGCFLCRVHGDV